MNRNIIYSIMALLLAGFFAACSADDSGALSVDGPQRLELKPVMSPLTRSVTAYDNSRWWFDGNDQIGFYSTVAGDNIPMHFTESGGTFIADENKIVDYNNIGQCFAYCPYYADMENGMPLRIEGTNRCEDLLATSYVRFLPGEGLTANFVHAFVLLLFKGDTGFTNLLKNGEPDITVRMNKAVDKVYAYSWGITLGESTDEELKKFTGTVDSYAAIDVKDNQYVQVPTDTAVYCVLVPFSKTQGVLMESVEVTDDHGTVHRIDLSGLNAGANFGDRFLVTLKLENLKPVIYPHLIEKWNGDGVNIMIEDGHPEGINQPVDFGKWLTAYNSYIEGDQNQAQELRKYGYQDSKEKWHFFLNVDITYDNTTVAGSVAISALKDELDGRGHSISGLSLASESGAAAFIHKIDGGTLKNLNLESLSIVSREAYAGGIATEMTSGTITNCTLTKLNVNCPGGKVGALVGNMSGGTASDCSLRGIITGGSTRDNIVGAGSGTLSDIDAVNVIFGKQN